MTIFGRQSSSILSVIYIVFLPATFSFILRGIQVYVMAFSSNDGIASLIGLCSVAIQIAVVMFFLLKRDAVNSLISMACIIVVFYVQYTIGINNMLAAAYASNIELWGNLPTHCHAVADLDQDASMKLCSQEDWRAIGTSAFVVESNLDLSNLDVYNFNKPRTKYHKTTIPFGIIKYTVTHICEDYYLLVFRETDPVLLSDG